MKKRLLLVLTIVMLMCVAVFGVNAASCGAGNHTVAKKTVAPTCDTQGYEITYCAVCGEEFSKGNYTAELGHDMVNNYVANGDYYENRQTCQRPGCDVKDSVEGGASTPVKYFSVQFINAKATASYLESVNVDGVDVGVKHAKLTASWYNQGLGSTDVYVKEGGSYTYDGPKPTRNKDVDYGKYNFVGWTDSADNDTNTEPKYGTASDYNVTIKDIRENTVYYACWQGEVITYRIQFVNSDGSSWIAANNGEVVVPHGGKINYKWIFPSKDSTTSSDYKFIGWVCGDPSKTDADGKYTEFDEYLTKNIHIKNVPIYSADALKAKYEAVTREYKVEFDLKNGEAPFTANVAFGTRLDLKADGDDYKLTINGTDYKVPGEYNDSTYKYLFEGGFETTTGHLIKSHSFSVPPKSLDKNDTIFVEYATEPGKKVQADGKDMVLVPEVYDELKEIKCDTEGVDYILTTKDLFDYFNEELAYYNSCKANNVYYGEGRNFNLTTTTYLFLVSEHGDYLVDENGNKVTLEISLNGVYRVYITGAREKFTENDAEALRLVKVEPSYRSLIRKYPFVVEILMPIRIDGKVVEDSGATFNDLLTVQVKNQNGKLLGRANTNNNTNYTSYEFEDSKGNIYRKFFCVMSVEKAERYDITVASNDGRNKYEGTRTLFWTTYESMYNENDNALKSNITVDLSVTADYEKGLNCSCICHSMFSGLWARILNILHSLFKVQYECCPHMHSTIGDILAY